MGKYSAHVEDHLILPALARLPEGEAQARARAGQRVPVAVPVRLIIDTGSKRTTLIPGIIRHLNPLGSDTVRVATSLITGTTRFFWLRLDFPEAGLASFEVVQVIRLAMPPPLSQFHGVLGRDLLRRLESLDYEGQRGRYTLRDTPGLFGWLRRRL
jgi:hypothetical protein